MSYDFSFFKKRAQEIKEWLSGELSRIKTGRATPALVDKIMVDLYGIKTFLSHIASISVEDARTLRVTPWDKTQTKDIETAIQKANLGVSVSSDDGGVRVTVPELTGEAREKTLRLAKEKLEDARISLRQVRDEVWNEIKEKEKNKEISEDDKFRYKNELQKHFDEAEAALEKMLNEKKQEIMGN